MDAQALIQMLDPQELTYEAPALIVWEIGVASNADDVAMFLYHGGPFPPQASLRKPTGEDPRPDQKYWHFVKTEMHAFLCTEDKRYRELWKQIEALQKKSTTALVGIIAAFLGANIGAAATLLSGFVAVCLYAVIKVGKEAYCSYTGQDLT